MSMCNLQTVHKVLALRAAMSLFFKQKNFQQCNFFAKKLLRLLEANPNAAKPDVVSNIKTVQKICEHQSESQNLIDFEEAWLYDDDCVFMINPASFTLHRANNTLPCPFCKARYAKEAAESICSVCKLGKVGADALGPVLN